MTRKHLIIIMGVSGCGKTTIAKYISQHVSFKYMEADDFHSLENKRHMQSGQPLTDEMRWPWIRNICAAIHESDQDIVLSNSGLKSAHRACFRELNRHTNFIYLQTSQEIIQTRLAQRAGHFMPTSLLNSQFRDMDAPLTEEPIHIIDAGGLLPEVQAAALTCAKTLINKTNTDFEELSCG